MGKVVARKWRIIAARVADAVMDGVMPVVIMVGVCSVPAAVMRLKRVMRPANTGVPTSNNNVLSGEQPFAGVQVQELMVMSGALVGSPWPPPIG